jgi:LCP family protein required for cell wall assembly
MRWWRRKWKPVLQTVAALVSVALLAVLGYGWKNVNDLNRGAQTLPDIRGLGTVQPAGGGSPGASGATPGADLGQDIDGRDQNILVAGNDDRSDMTDKEVRELGTGRSGGSLNTDTMMIVHVPADGSKATIISLPRDSYVDIPGFVKNKLNVAYPDGYVYAPDGSSTTARRAAGASELIAAVKQLTGLTIDHFVEVDLIGFYRISLALGPITVNLCHATSDPTGSHFSAPAGPQRIVGKRALAFVRQRHGLRHGDVDRTARQRYFLAAAFRRVASAGTLLNPGRLHRLIDAVDRSVYVDRGFSIEKLAAQIADLNPNDIVGRAIPTGRSTTVSGVGSVLLVDPAKVKRFVTDLIDGKAARPSGAAGPSGTTQHSASPTPPAPIDAGCIN